MDILTSLDFLRADSEFPPPSQLARLAKYRHNKALFDKKGGAIDRKSYNHVVQVMDNHWRVVPYRLLLNLYRKISYKTADMLFVEAPVFGSVESNEASDINSQIVSEVVSNSNLVMLGWQAGIDTSRYGDGVLVVTERETEDGMRGVLTITQPMYWYPVADPEDLRNIKYQVLAWYKEIESKSKQREFMLTVHIHERGFVTKHEAIMRGGKIVSIDEGERTETGLTDFAVLPIQPTLTSDSAFSADDYTDIEDIIIELQTRIQQIARVLDKHADPSMTGSINNLEKDPVTGEATLKVGGFYARESNDDPKTEYITWDGQLEASFKEIDLMMNLLAIISEMGPAIFYDEILKIGSLSGRAIRMLYTNALNKVARTRNAFDGVLKSGIALASQLGYSSQVTKADVSIKWNDGLPDDPMEKAEIGKIRLDNAPSDDPVSQIMAQDGMTKEQAEEKYVRMQENDAQNVPPLNLGGFTQDVKENNE